MATVDNNQITQSAADSTNNTASTASAQPKLEGKALEDAIKKQIEYYLSRDNLSTDYYLTSRMNNEMFVALEVIANFKMVKNLTTDINLIIEVMSKSSNVILDETKTLIKPSFKLQRNIIILRDISAETPVEEIKAIFSETGKTISSVRSDIGNNWFIQFDKEEDALEAHDQIKNLTFKDKHIKARIKTESLMKTPTPQQQAQVQHTQQPHRNGSFTPYQSSGAASSATSSHRYYNSNNSSNNTGAPVKQWSRNYNNSYDQSATTSTGERKHYSRGPKDTNRPPRQNRDYNNTYNNNSNNTTVPSTVVPKDLNNTTTATTTTTTTENTEIKQQHHNNNIEKRHHNNNNNSHHHHNNSTSNQRKPKHISNAPSTTTTTTTTTATLTVNATTTTTTTTPATTTTTSTPTTTTTTERKSSISKPKSTTASTTATNGKPNTHKKISNNASNNTNTNDENKEHNHKSTVKTTASAVLQAPPTGLQHFPPLNGEQPKETPAETKKMEWGPADKSVVIESSTPVAVVSNNVATTVGTSSSSSSSAAQTTTSTSPSTASTTSGTNSPAKSSNGSGNKKSSSPSSPSTPSKKSPSKVVAPAAVVVDDKKTKSTTAAKVEPTTKKVDESKPAPVATTTTANKQPTYADMIAMASNNTLPVAPVVTAAVSENNASPVEQQ